MKTIVLLVGVILLFATSGCLVEERGYGHYHHHYSHREVYVAPVPPPVVVRPPEVIIR